jgi:nitrate reductase NapE component
MQTFTLTLGSWLRRLLVRNALVRTSDRFEAFAMLLALLFAILAVPVAGAAGTAVYDNRIHVFADERMVRHEVEATATHDSSVTALPFQFSYVSEVRWEFAGQTHTGVASTRNRMKTGDQTSVWVDAAGEPTPPPRGDKDAAAEAVMAAIGLWIAVAGAAAGGYAVVRARLNHLRHAAWDRALADLADNDGRTNHNT